MNDPLCPPPALLLHGRPPSPPPLPSLQELECPKVTSRKGKGIPDAEVAELLKDEVDERVKISVWKTLQISLTPFALTEMKSLSGMVNYLLCCCCKRVLLKCFFVSPSRQWNV